MVCQTIFTCVLIGSLFSMVVQYLILVNNTELTESPLLVLNRKYSFLKDHMQGAIVCYLWHVLIDLSLEKLGLSW